jgi:hypothetical protein
MLAPVSSTLILVSSFAVHDTLIVLPVHPPQILLYLAWFHAMFGMAAWMAVAYEVGSTYLHQEGSCSEPGGNTSVCTWEDFGQL